MKHKGKAIQFQQSTVTDLITHLASLPEREKSPEDPVTLPEIFRTKEYMAEIRGALKRGYTFEDLSKIFTEKCGVMVSVRQLKYHYTRGKNKPQRGRFPSSKLTQKENSDDGMENIVTAKPAAKSVSNDVGISSINDKTMDSKPVKSGSFDIDMQQEEI